MRSPVRALVRRYRQVTSEPERGITLTELIVAMALSTILGTMTLFVFLGLNTASTTTIQRSISATEARVILSSWNSLLQVAESPVRNDGAKPAFARLDSSAVCFYASIDNRSPAVGAANFSAPTPVKLYQDGDSVVEERFLPSYNDDCASDPVVRRVLGTRASVTFTGFDKMGSPVASGSTGAALENVATVAIALTVTDRFGETHEYDAIPAAVAP
jgi:Tfp pilus assembly protein PilW